jgi:hypothetical protein
MQELKSLGIQLSSVASIVDRVICIFESFSANEFLRTDAVDISGIDVNSVSTEFAKKVAWDCLTPDRAPEDACTATERAQDFSTFPGPSQSRSSTSPTTPNRFRRRCIVGRGPTNSRLTPAARVAEFFVFNVNKTVTVADLMDYLKPKVTVLGLTLISHPCSASKSFMLSVPLEEEYLVSDPNFWPFDIKCRNFVRPITGRLAYH